VDVLLLAPAGSGDDVLVDLDLHVGSDLALMLAAALRRI